MAAFGTTEVALIQTFRVWIGSLSDMLSRLGHKRWDLSLRSKSECWQLNTGRWWLTPESWRLTT